MKGSTFQMVMLGIFLALALGGVLFFALFSGEDEKDSIGQVTIWGTMEARVFEQLIETSQPYINGARERITYVEKDERFYQDELIDALAAGVGPDLFFLRAENTLQNKNKVFVLPYESYSQRRFKDAYIEGSEIFLAEEGIIAFPLTVDPLVMYWNRDLLSSEGEPLPPEFWDEFLSLSPKITKRDQALNILRATVALGEFRNVNHAKDILATLMLQAGNPIATRGITGSFQARFLELFDYAIPPAESALRFYTEFSNPIKSVYSWNRALPSSREAFLAGDLVFYFGYASEIDNLREANPNLNFDVTLFPQSREKSLRATSGRFQGLAIANASQNKAGALRVATVFTSDPILEQLQKEIGLPPVSRKLLKTAPSDAIQPVFYSSALIARTWPDPHAEKTTAIFREMVESVTSGRLRIFESLREANSELGALYL